MGSILLIGMGFVPVRVVGDVKYKSSNIFG